MAKRTAIPPGPTWTLAELSAAAAQCWEDGLALLIDEDGTRLSFRELERRSNAIAHALLAAGIEPGNRVAVMLPNRAQFPLSWLALAKIRAQMVPVNTAFKDVDARRVLVHSEATAVISSQEFLPLIRRCQAPNLRRYFSVDGEEEGDAVNLREAAKSGVDRPPSIPVAPEDIVSIQYTSGTTGMPKGCMLSNSFWSFLARRLVQESPIINAHDVMLTAQPFYYLDPQWNLAVAMASGASLVVLDRFHPSSFWSKVRQYGVTFFYCLGVMPTLLHKMPAAPTDRDNNVRLVWCSAIPPKLHRALEERFGAPWLEISGMTETGADIYVSPEEHDELVGSGCVGRPYSCREARVVDDADRPLPRGQIGELVFRGTGMFDGYFKDPDATSQVFRGGWFHTGDLVRTDESGRYYYVGRKQEVIRRSGETISAAEVEEVLLAHGAVQVAACVPVPDDLRGQEIKAYVVLEPGCTPEATSPEQLAAYCLEKLAYFKVPRYWEYKRSLPMTSSERVAKAELRRERPDLRSGSYDRIEKVWRD